MSWFFWQKIQIGYYGEIFLNENRESFLTSNPLLFSFFRVLFCGKLHGSVDGSLSDTAAAAAAGGEGAKKGIMKTQGGITGVINAANEAGSEGQGGLGMMHVPPAANAGRLSILQQPGVGGPGGGPGGLGGMPSGPGVGGPGGMGKKSSSTSQLSAAGNIFHSKQRTYDIFNSGLWKEDTY